MTQSTETAPAADTKKKSPVDTLVTELTVRTAKGLVLTKRGLEASARWLDGRAKAVGDLATKLAPPAPEQPSS